MPATRAGSVSLLTLLEHESRSLRELLPLLSAEREALRTRSAQKLLTLHHKKLSLFETLRDFEAQRELLLADLAAQWSRATRAVTLAEAAEQIGGEEGRRLLAIRETLRELVDQVRDESALNRQIVEVSATVLDQCLSVRSPVDMGEQLYSAFGTPQSSAPEAALLRRRG
jgi:flagellar biosynthesis/type III secretory pathway chaperone